MVRKRLPVTAFAVAAVLLVTDYWAFSYGLPPPGPSANQSENGLWLRCTWYFGRHTPSETERLAHKLADAQVRYAFFHVRDITPEGQLRYRFPESARRLIVTIHRDSPSVRAVAWIYAGNRRGGGSVDLANARVRRQMADQARWLVTVCGFDGVQWDYEICDDRDADFIRLLGETRDAVRGNPRCRVLIGVPTYAEGGLSHSAHAENIRIALWGTRAGLADPRASRSAFAGVSVFADYTTQPDEWETYRRLWLMQ